MSNNNSSANIIINSMIHHSRLSLKGINSKVKKTNKTKQNKQVVGQKLILVEGVFMGEVKMLGCSKLLTKEPYIYLICDQS